MRTEISEAAHIRRRKRTNSALLCMNYDHDHLDTHCEIDVLLQDTIFDADTMYILSCASV
jgi:hypothetical protein